jgi:LPXTG-motif cell wall-anchored protein
MALRSLRVAIGVGVALAVALIASPAGAQPYPPAAGALTISDTVVVPGETVTLSFGGSPPGSTWTFTFLSEPVVLGTATADANGVVTFTTRIPADAAPGTHTIQAVNEAGTVVSVTVTVAGEAAQATSGRNLPFTGSNTAWLVRLGVVLLVGGGLVFLAARRRRTTSREPELDQV